MQTVTQQKKVKEVMKKVSYLFFMYNTLHAISPTALKNKILLLEKVLNMQPKVQQKKVK
jgi:hypothetical protein